MQVSMYASSFDFEGANGDLDAIIQAIKNGRWRKKIDLCRILLRINKSFYDQKKIYLPAVTFSGIFIRRVIDGLKEYSNIICVDVDNICPNRVKEILKADKHIYCMFASPSNNGLKILIKVDNNPDYHKEAVLHLIDYFKDTYGMEIDKSCKDVSRLCYVSYDPDLRLNDEDEVFKVDVDKYRIPVVPIYKAGEMPKTESIPYIFDFCCRIAEGSFPFRNGNRNNHMYYLGNLLNERGIEKDDAINFIENNYPPMPEDCILAVKYVYRKNESKFNTRQFKTNEPKIAKLG